jgi:hypothetical protein
LLVFLRKKDAKAFFRTSNGQMLIIGPAVGLSTLATTVGLTEKIEARLSQRTPFELEIGAQAKALYEGEPAFRERLKNKSSAEASAAVRELAGKGVRRLPMADLRRLGAIRLALAEGSPLFCATLWAGPQNDAHLAEATARLTEREMQEFARLVTTGLRLEVRGEGVERAPPTPEQTDAFFQTLFERQRPEDSSELRQTIAQGEHAPPEAGCRAVRTMLSSLPSLSDDDVSVAMLLF